MKNFHKKIIKEKKIEEMFNSNKHEANQNNMHYLRNKYVNLIFFNCLVT